MLLTWHIDMQGSLLCKDQNVSWNVSGCGLSEEPSMLLKMCMWRCISDLKNVPLSCSANTVINCSNVQISEKSSGLSRYKMILHVSSRNILA